MAETFAERIRREDAERQERTRQAEEAQRQRDWKEFWWGKF